MKCSSCLVFKLFIPTCLIKSIKHEHLCKVLYVYIIELLKTRRLTGHLNLENTIKNAIIIIIKTDLTVDIYLNTNASYPMVGFNKKFHINVRHFKHYTFLFQCDHNIQHKRAPTL